MAPLGPLRVNNQSIFSILQSIVYKVHSLNFEQVSIDLNRKLVERSVSGILKRVFW